ncbi:glycosyltransferase family 39 protein [Patescibacteria group bacterium]|nr:glycosyltransferase family 39 protein [Patescibacteria group bacterium]
MLTKWGKRLLVSLFLVFLSFAIYLYKVEEITPGAWGDEIVIGQTSEKLVKSPGFSVFVDVNYGHPTPLLYLTGSVTNLFGKSLTSLRLVSIMFGALGVGLSYLLFTLFFDEQVSFLGALAMLTSYPLIIISRFAYEATAAIFFGVLSILFGIQMVKTKKVYWALLFGVALGAGIYTYLGFRTMAPLIFLVFSLILFKQEAPRKALVKTLLVMFTVAVISSPILIYAFRNPQQFWARTKSVSIFNYNLSPSGILKEFGAGTARTIGMFFVTGDPNPRQNPSGTTMFDLLTTCLMLVGVVYLWRKNKVVAYVCLFLAISPLINDIFTVEFFPEFHYYGTGHPNVLRVSGIIPIVYFLVTAGLASIKSFLSTQLDKKKVVWVLILIVGIALLINLGRYFGQTVSRFNYVINGAGEIKIAKYINKSQKHKIVLSPSLYNDIRIQYLVNDKTLEKSDTIPSEELTIIKSTDNPEVIKKILAGGEIKPVEVFVNPWSEVEAVAVYEVNTQ